MNKLFYYKQLAYPYNYFVLGRGFVATKVTASKLTADQVSAVRLSGFEPGITEEIVSSFAVNYVRPQDLNAQGGVNRNTLNPSRRRFATADEAHQHGSRFRTRKAYAGAAPGSAGHIGYWVTESTDPVNASINWKTGLTNSI